MKKGKMKQERGVTLIALVITIIVLLVLAAAAIATLTGDNGIFSNAQNARAENKRAEVKEKYLLVYNTVRTQVLTESTMNGEYHSNSEESSKKLVELVLQDITGQKQTVTSTFSNQEYKADSGIYTISYAKPENRTYYEINIKYTDSIFKEGGRITSLDKDTNPIETTITIMDNECNFKINNDGYGDVENYGEDVMAAEIAANPQNYYGKKVTNYTAGGKTYRIFYVDKAGDFGPANTIYLKADWSANDTTCSSSYTSSTKVREMNPSWNAARGSSESSWNDNEKVAAWLCDPTKWTTYLDENMADYVIGAPSVEMYVKSYNQAYSGISGTYALGATYRATNYPGYIYTLYEPQSTISNSSYWTKNDSLDVTRYNSIYCGKDGEKGDYNWWLASPSSYSSYDMCSVKGDSARLFVSNVGSNNSVAPLVSLKPGVTLEIEE